jgi:hypothetical protein
LEFVYKLEIHDTILNHQVNSYARKRWRQQNIGRWNWYLWNCSRKNWLLSASCTYRKMYCVQACAKILKTVRLKMWFGEFNNFTQNVCGIIF